MKFAAPIAGAALLAGLIVPGLSAAADNKIAAGPDLGRRDAQRPEGDHQPRPRPARHHPRGLPEDRPRLPALLRPAHAPDARCRDHRRAGGPRLPQARRRGRHVRPGGGLAHPRLGDARDHPGLGQHPLDQDQHGHRRAPSRPPPRRRPSTRSWPTQFGAAKGASGWDFSKAKTLVLFCNGIWCPQSSINIKTLVKLGYPADKIKWYRGGMQDWFSVGLTTVKP